MAGSQSTKNFIQVGDTIHCHNQQDLKDVMYKLGNKYKFRIDLDDDLKRHDLIITEVNADD